MDMMDMDMWDVTLNVNPQSRKVLFATRTRKRTRKRQLGVKRVEAQGGAQGPEPTLSASSEHAQSMLRPM